MKLNNEEQQLILDFYFRCGSDEEIAHGRDLIAANSEAARLYAGLEETLTELDSIKYEPCPENLADLTVARLKLAASAGRAGQAQASSQSNLEQLLEAERQKTAATAGIASTTKTPPTQRLLHNFFEIAAIAAAVVLVSGILFPTASYMRQKSRLTTCNANMMSIGRGMNQFSTDHEKNLAGVKLAAGSPWWKIGDQGQQSQSNTRFAWQLAKQGYVKPEAFVCAGHRNGVPVTAEQLLSQLQDFSSRNNISYSFIIISDKTALQGGPRKIVMGDMNPIFRSIPTCGNNPAQKAAEFEKILLDNHLRQMCSSNHNCKGQNVLYSDGSVEFAPQRLVNGDDIFTVLGVDTYTGTETPADENDVFLVP